MFNRLFKRGYARRAPSYKQQGSGEETAWPTAQKYGAVYENSIIHFSPGTLPFGVFHTALPRQRNRNLGHCSLIGGAHSVGFAKSKTAAHWKVPPRLRAATCHCIVVATGPAK